MPKGGVFAVLVIHLNEEERERAVRALASAPSLGLGTITLGAPEQGQVQFILDGIREAPVNPQIIRQIETEENRS